MNSSVKKRCQYLTQHKQGFFFLAAIFFGGALFTPRNNPLQTTLAVISVIFAWWGYKVGMTIDSIERALERLETEANPDFLTLEQNSLKYQIEQPLWKILFSF